MPANNEHGTEGFSPDHVFDGGAMDCGSGLILLIRQNMMQVPEGGLLEIRSSEPTVSTELPPWCRMVGHSHLESIEVDPGQWSHFIQRGTDQNSDVAELKSDEDQAKSFEWSLRGRRSAANATTVYSRNFSWKSGSSIDFDKTGDLPTALEQLLGAILSDVIASFSTRCSRSSILLDDLECTIKGMLNNSLAAVGIERGDSSLSKIALVMYVTSPAPEEKLSKTWEDCLSDSPVYQTLNKACEIDARLVLL